MNKESIVFVVQQEDVKRMLGMYLAAVGLDARIYPDTEDYLALHDSSRTQYLVLDMQLPGMDGAILQREKIATEESNEITSETFRLIPIQNILSCESFLSGRFASRGVIVDGVDNTILEEWES
jgi:CheY-like chemotaxis protein